MSFFRSNKFITFICLLLSALLVVLGILSFLPTPNCSSTSGSLISAANGSFDMFKSFTALKTWLATVPYYVYLSVVLGLFVIAVLSLVIAIFKKARHRRNDVNVLILVGDEDEKVDATVFKEHYAVVVVAKPSSLSPIQPRVLPPIIPLENNKRYIPIPNENPIQSEEKEDIIVVEQPVETKPEVVAPKAEPIVKEPIQAQEPAPQEKQVVEAPKPKEQPPIIVVEEPKEEPTLNMQEIINSQKAPQEPAPTVSQVVNMDEVFENAYADVNTSNIEEEELYDESEFVTENFEEVAFEQEEFNVSPIIINNYPEIEEEQIAPIDNDQFEKDIFQEEKVKQSVNNSVVDNDLTYLQNYQTDSQEVMFEEEATTQDVALATITENKNNVVLLATSPKTNTEDSAYAIVKEKDATEEAIDAVRNGAIIVDADGDDIVDEVLEDKDILKLRYKTVELDKRLRRAEEDVKGYYSDLKNALLSYKGVKSRLSKKFDTFTLGRFIVAKLALRGNVINMYLALPSEQVDDKYFAEDVSDSDTYGKTPTLHKVKSKRGCKYGVELIHELLTAISVSKIEDFQPIDYVEMYPPENIDEKKKDIEHLMTDRAFIEDVDVLSDEQALEFIQIVKDKNHTINKFNPINKFVAFVDDIAELYEPNQTVTIESLVKAGALPDMENLFLEIRGKGYIDKPLTFEAHSFDIKAVKMITLLNGNVIQYK